MPSVLTSWKEISSHLGKGLRTVQRWEIELGLPIHRSRAGPRRTIFAIPEELDSWARSHPHAPAAAVVESLRKELASLRSEIDHLRHRLDRIEIPRPLPGREVVSHHPSPLKENDGRRPTLGLRAHLEQSQALREQSEILRSRSEVLRVQSQAACGQSRVLRSMARSLHARPDRRQARTVIAPRPSAPSAPSD